MKKATKQSRRTKVRKDRQAAAYLRFRRWFIGNHHVAPLSWGHLSERAKQLIVEKFG